MQWPPIQTSYSSKTIGRGFLSLFTNTILGSSVAKLLARLPAEKYCACISACLSKETRATEEYTYE